MELPLTKMRKIMDRASLVGKSTKSEMFVRHPSRDIKLYSKKIGIKRPKKKRYQ